MNSSTQRTQLLLLKQKHIKVSQPSFFTTVDLYLVFLISKILRSLPCNRVLFQPCNMLQAQVLVNKKHY